MKILWIVNTIFPIPSKELGLPEPVVGGWMYGLAKQVSETLGVELAVATTSVFTEVKKIDKHGIKYYILPCNNNTKYEPKLENYWTEVCNEFQPDVVHIHGTEFAHGLACLRKLPNIKYVVSIQGLVGVYAKYYYAGIGFNDIIRSVTLRDFVRMDMIWQQKIKFQRRGKLESEYLKKANHVIGRTQWDKSHVMIFNPRVSYHFCNESLRNRFYESEKWSLGNCNKHTIFLSQAGYPIKGLHQIIKSVNLLKDEFPQIKIRIAGQNIFKDRTFFEKLKMSGYAKYIKSLLNKYNLNSYFEFTGQLNESGIIKEFLNSNIFICPSSIENSPNSIGEAQILGVPCVASFVGGIPDMIKHDVDGLIYRFEEYEMLASHIKNVFLDDILTNRLSSNSIKTAERRHNVYRNCERTVEIYKQILI
ncbi:glycosyltransferase family 4 protein [Flavobacterium sp.]|uniref:glycosyltransferase family 4 protein n=1 Tax=Flavobacterium sp. TaxID=239 RepID=UPI001B4B9B82|nr:glycosyltransferase family 4 protein [Flavobacterium sp.]MBP6182582.1 glycosyltransferase family 4 protein [Flavobacterium sp.]